MTHTQTEIVLDKRRRTSLARIGRRSDERYLVEEKEDGTLIMTPAVLVSQHELDLLRNPRFVKAVEQAEAGQMVRRARQPRHEKVEA